MVKILSKDLLSVDHPVWKYEEGFRLSEQFGASHLDNGKFVREILQPEDFGTGWTTRQRYEIDAGRDMEPLLYQPFYQLMPDGNYGSTVTINTIGPGGVVMNQLLPGGETKMASIGSGSKSIPLYDYTVGIEYSERMFVYNEFFGMEIFERQAGIANNALLNHIHLYPYLSAVYAAANQTAASAIGATLAEKYLHTLEDAITNASTDMTTTVLGFPNRRRGPYYVLCSMANFFTLERAISGNQPGGGVDLNSSARTKIQGIVAYDGWTGIMNGVTTSYPGVSAGTCYLIDVSAAAKMMYALSLEKFILRQLLGNEDVSRLVRQQEVLWSSVGIYNNALALAEEITLPTS